ncbi:MAG: transposase [Rhodanobacteraceae bacterium]|nr:transposase [Rhodanobacteraceae bacterium]
MDLTGKAELDGRQRMILGVLDHGSRALLALRELAVKRSLTILLTLIALFRCSGLPRRIRVDNEACFVSRRMRFALRLLGIELQRIAPHCPWQNGRIERLFGTLKQQLDRVCIVSTQDLQRKLIEFRCWYNHVRPHQHLRGRTPAEAWEGSKKATGTPQRFCGWGGLHKSSEVAFIHEPISFPTS